MSNSYRDLVVWEKAKALSLQVYGLTKVFPREVIYGLTSQVRRAAVSVVSNIAEGQGKITTREFIQFLGHARGSLFEVQTQLEMLSISGTSQNLLSSILKKMRNTFAQCSYAL